jgi:hypothetical protein
MRLDRFLHVVAAVVLLPVTALSQSDAEKSVLATVNRVFEGMRTADSAMVRSTFATGARFASIDSRATPVVVRYETIDDWLSGVANSARRWDEQVYDVQVKVDGNMAHVWAPYTFYLDKAVRHCGINSLELLHDASGWRITQLSDTRRREGCKDVLAK